MVIKASSGKQLDHLIADLNSDRVDTREAAVARIAIIGERAVERLASVVEQSKNAAARVSALRALEAIGGNRALDVAVTATEDTDVNVVIAAIGVARGFVKGARGVAVVDRLTAVTLDQQKPEAVRGAAFRTLSELGEKTVAPLRTALADSQVSAPSFASGPAATAETPIEWLQAAVETALPDDVETLRAAVATRGETLPLPGLQRLIERVRDREQAETGARRAEWMRVRGAAHLALARRGSRLALYDLRESLEGAANPLPVEFLASLREIGDASCLEPLAMAFSRAPGGDNWWRRHLLDAFRAIVSRGRITRRHAAMKRIASRAPEILQDAGS